MFNSIKEFLSPLTKRQSFVILIIFIIGSFTRDYFKEDKVVLAIEKLGATIEERNLGQVTKSGATYIYTKTYLAAERNIRLEISDIIKENSIDNNYKQLEIRDRLNQRIKYFHRMDYASLNEFKFNGVPLSYVLKDQQPELVTEKLTNYLFTHTQYDHILLTENVDKILRDIYNEYLTQSIAQLNKL